MLGARVWWLLALLLGPLACLADEADLPELGIRLTALPAEATKPQVTPAPGGLTASAQLGPAVLTIYRDSTLTPPGGDVADPKFRSALDARFDRAIDSKTQGAPTNVGGHSGWTVVSVRPASAGATLYTCLTYVIAEQHLYRLVVRASSAQGRPHEFDTLVNAMSGIQFGSAPPPGSPAAQSPP
jgi:hypothetical protein